MSDDIENNDDFEIEIVDDTPEEDRDKARRPEGKEPDIGDDDEIASYSEGVQKRIKKLRYEFHEERRSKEEQARLAAEAVTAAKKLHEENLRLRRTLEEGEGVLINQAKQRLAVQVDQAKAAYKQAYELGDADAITEAQMKLNELQAEQHRVNNFKPQRAPVTPAPAPQQQPQAQVQPKAPKPSQRAEEWQKKNSWFGSDEEMTVYAMRVHERIVKEGVAPDSEEYYTQINQSVRRVFADKLGGEAEDRAPRRQAGNVVAPASRMTGGTPRKITLSQTQVSLAKRLGLTPQQYAAQLVKDSSNG